MVNAAYIQDQLHYKFGAQSSTASTADKQMFIDACVGAASYLSITADRVVILFVRIFCLCNVKRLFL